MLYIYMSRYRLVDLDALVAQLVLCLCDLAQEALVGLWCVVEAHQSESKRHQGVGAECDQQPPWQLSSAILNHTEDFEGIAMTPGSMNVPCFAMDVWSRRAEEQTDNATTLTTGKISSTSSSDKNGTGRM